jgi:hypothetical protein
VNVERLIDLIQRHLIDLILIVVAMRWGRSGSGSLIESLARSGGNVTGITLLAEN